MGSLIMSHYSNKEHRLRFDLLNPDRSVIIQGFANALARLTKVVSQQNTCKPVRRTRQLQSSTGITNQSQVMMGQSDSVLSAVDRSGAATEL